MTSAYILVAAILLLGGLIAVLGDHLGTKIGKARLRLFKLRPRQTARVITILTGTLISASTLGILFSLSESLREGLFELDDILKDLRQYKAEIKEVEQQKQLVEEELAAAQVRQGQVQKRLSQINQNYRQAQNQLKAVFEQVDTLRSEIKTLLSERQKLIEQRNQLNNQAKQLSRQVQRQGNELQKQEQQIAAQDRIIQDREARLQQLESQQAKLQIEVSRQDEKIAEFDRQIVAKDLFLKVREIRLKNLESEIAFLNREVEELEQYYQNYQNLRASQIMLLRGQVLAFASVQLVEPDAAIPTIDRLLQEANRNAIQSVGLSDAENKRIVKITEAQVEQLIGQIQDGQEYVVRILSAGNYVQDEEEIRVFADVAPNQEIFGAGDAIAAVSIDPTTMTPDDMQQRLDWLLAASQFRARRAGVLGEIQISDGQWTTLVGFIEQLNQSQEPLEELQAVASDTTYAAGPLKLRLVAVRNGKIIFST